MQINTSQQAPLSGSYARAAGLTPLLGALPARLLTTFGRWRLPASSAEFHVLACDLLDSLAHPKPPPSFGTPRASPYKDGEQAVPGAPALRDGGVMPKIHE
jgi:hypothetical protein